MSFKMYRFLKQYLGAKTAAEAARKRGVSLAQVQLWLRSC